MPSQILKLDLEAGYSLKQAPEPKGVILLLHGYLQEGEIILRLLENYLPPDFSIVAPNAPLPMAHQYGNRLKLAYTWYLYDPPHDRYLLDMGFALNYLRELAAALSFAHLPLKIIGYSQGGYLAPFAGLTLPNIRQVIGLNCRFRSETIREKLPYRLDAIHGQDDSMVDPARAHQCHGEIMAHGNDGEFHFVPNSGHRITPALGAELRALLKKA